MKAKIKLAYRVQIDQNSKPLWEKYIFEDTYLEYRIQHQVFDKDGEAVQNYWELLKKNEFAARIPFLLSAIASNYVLQLAGVIRTLPDVLGSTFFPFVDFKLDLVSSNVEDISKHRIGLTFFTPELLWIDTVDNKYLLSDDVQKSESYTTFMLPFHQQVAICNFTPITSH